MRKGPLYFLSARYWGWEPAAAADPAEGGEGGEEEGLDEDVAEEERVVRARANGPMAAESALEVRGLRATFRRGGAPFHAVKAPWFAVGRRQLFALLGPNGAGKTTAINMLTGALPPTAGNA